MFRYPFVATGLLILGLLFGCTDQRKVEIGFLGGLSGPASDLGIDGRRGVQLAVEEYNEETGSRTDHVTLLSFDLGNDPRSAREGFDSFVEAGVAAIVGPFTSEMCGAVMPQIRQTGQLVISPTASSPEFSGRDDSFLRTYPESSVQARNFARFLVEETNCRRLAVIYDECNRAHTEAYEQSLRHAFAEQGGTALAPIPVGKDSQITHRTIIEQALSADPDALFLLANALDSAEFCQQLAKTETEVSVFGSEWSYSNNLREFGGKSVEGFAFIQIIDLLDSDPAFRDFVRRYENRFGIPPGFASALAYDATRIVLEGIREGHRNELKAWILERRRFEGLQGPIVFDPFGDCQRPAHLMKIKGGQLHRVAHFK